MTTLRKFVIVAGVIAAILLGVLVWAAFAIVQLVDDRDKAIDDRNDAITLTKLTADQNKQAADQLAQQIKDLGKTPVVNTKNLDSGTAVLRGWPGANGKNGLPGLNGTNGTNGKTGSDGLPGKDGTNGQDGAPGATGAQGERGEQGPEGKQGRGIASLACTGGLSPVTYTVTYTDGTTQEFTCGDLQPVGP